jgi:hypothetical protein
VVHYTNKQKKQKISFRQKNKRRQKYCYSSAKQVCPGIADSGTNFSGTGSSIKCGCKTACRLRALSYLAVNGQRHERTTFEFVGYLPIETATDIKAVKEMEINSQKKTKYTNIHMKHLTATTS